MKLDDANLVGDEPLEHSNFDMLKSMQWAGWLARAKLDEGFYSVGAVDEIRERKMFEHWYGELTKDGAA